ncbi:ABC transporter permease subunit [Nocardioides salsibiostraticola]
MTTSAITWRARLRVGLIAGVVLLPLIPLAVWSIAGTWRYPDLVPQRFTDRGLGLVASGDVLRALGTSLLVSTSVAVLATLIGLSAGRAIGLHRFRGRRLVQFLLLAPVIVPGLAVTLGLQIFFIRYGLADTVTGVVLVQLMPTVPYAATLLGAAYANFETDYERQARSLGAGALRTQLLVTLPLLRPALLTTALLTFLISWSEYILTLLIGGGTVTTLPLLLFSAIGSSDRTAAAALGMLVVVPPVVLVVVATKVFGSRSPDWMGLARG